MPSKVAALKMLGSHHITVTPVHADSTDGVQPTAWECRAKTLSGVYILAGPDTGTYAAGRIMVGYLRYFLATLSCSGSTIILSCSGAPMRCMQLQEASDSRFKHAETAAASLFLSRV